MNYRKLSSIIYALLIVLSIVAPITFIGNVARATITGRPVIQFYNATSDSITSPTLGVVEVPAILSNGDKLIVNFSSVDFSTSGAMIWIWFSKEKNGGAEIDSEDGVFIGPIKVSDIQSTTSKPIEVDVYKPFDKILGNKITVEVGNKMINITKLPGMFYYGTKYWIKITDVSPDRGVSIPSSDVSVSTNLILFKTAYYAYSKLGNDNKTVPFEPLTVGAYCAPENNEFNITMNVVNKNWTVKTEVVVEDNYIGGKWEWTGFEFSTSDDASFKAPDLKGAYQSGQPSYYTFKVEIMNQTQLFASFTFEQPVRKVYLPGDTSGVLREYGGDYTGSLTLYTGEEYNITLENFPYDGNVVIKLNKTKVAEIKLLENGSKHNVTIKIPYVAKSGDYNFTVDDGSFIYWFKVHVEIKPEIELIPDKGYVGTEVKVYFHYFSDYVGDRLNIWFQINSTHFALVANFTMTDEIARGDKPVIITVPHATCDVKDVRVYLDKTGLKSPAKETDLGTDYKAHATFKVIPHIIVDPNVFPNDGRIVKVIGTGFCKHYVYAIEIDNHYLADTAADEVGDLYVEFVATGFAPGLHSIALYPYHADSAVVNRVPEFVAYFNVTGTSLEDVMAKLDEIEKMLTNMSETLLVIKDNVAYLVSETQSISVSIDDLKVMITQLGDKIELKLDDVNSSLTKLIIKKGDEVVGTLTTKLSDLDAKITDVSNNIVTISTKIGDIKTTIDDLKNGQAEIKDLIKTKSGDIVGVIDTTKGDILAELSTLEDLIKNGVKVDTENILAKIDELKSSVGTASDKLDALAASLDNVKSSLDDVKSSVSAVKSSVEGIKSSVSSAISSAVDDLKTSIEDKANSVSGNVSTYGLVNLILILVAIILTAYVGFFHKKE